MIRQIITIDEKKCTGCSDCIPACPEGALQVIDGKARLVSDLFCDGLGACVGHCPTGAMNVVSREAEPYDEKRVMQESIAKAGTNVIAAHLRHLAGHGQENYLRLALEYLEEQGIPNPLEERISPAVEVHAAEKRHTAGNVHAGGCPGSRTVVFGTEENTSPTEDSAAAAAPRSALRHWPIQLHLVSPIAPYFQGSDLLLAADCTAFAVGGFHSAFMKGKSLAIACPKLDTNMEVYVEKLSAMIDMAKINTITVAIMEVPCCLGLVSIVSEALGKASRKVPVKKVVVGLQGGILSEEWL
ncbi:MAG: 4Fe-4S binding protein [Chlorobiaceae bacterium]|nr:4Fe-4S binding protein [Chlorobiaceae bacterium]NTV60558.1 4Fe-4S binding protein [Chlorobiaceae bacterium]